MILFGKYENACMRNENNVTLKTVIKYCGEAMLLRPCSYLLCVRIYTMHVLFLALLKNSMCIHLYIYFYYLPIL